MNDGHKNAEQTLSQKPATTPDRPGLLGLIGNTPLVPLRVVNPNPKVEVYAKLERNNPGGSVKDRIALWMIEQAERTGELTRDKTILEATSGNTGIGLAMVAALKGYRITLAMSEGVSVERRKILAAFGAEFLLTPAERGTDGAIERAYELGDEQSDRYYLTDQFNNPANILAHYESTAPEIWEQSGGRITHFVTTMGTTGTLMGCAKRLREYNPDIRIIGVEPYLGHRIQGLKNLKEAYIPGIYHAKNIDQKVNIEDEAAYDMARRLAREEGLLVGMSSGAAAYVACELARELEAGVIVTILPDGGERYLSTTLFQVAEPEAVPVRLHFFNTLTHKHEPFEPLHARAGGPACGGDQEPAGEVTMYCCGPTVHQRPHLGLLRRMLADDLVRRSLLLAGYAVKQVVSITDIDDLTIQESERSGEKLADLCARNQAAFHQDLQALGVGPASAYVRSSESVEEMIALARSLVDKGYAYEKLNSVYFNIGKLKSYGELSGKDLGKIKLGATVDLERYDKDDPRDFTLFRRCTLSEMRKGLSYKTEWGNVRPSWHVECSAMARAQLGDRFDIHTGSVDLVFPHNENEIAQSRALTGEPGARYWLHSELVLVGGKKMTYQEQSRVTLPDLLERGYSARDVRFFLLQTHYRQPINLTDEALGAARASLRRIDAFWEALSAAEPREQRVADLAGWLVRLKDDFTAAIFDDINISAALAAVFRLVRQVNHLLAGGGLCPEDVEEVKTALRQADSVLAVLPGDEQPEALPDEVQGLVERRKQARQQGDFARADELRQKLADLGYEVKDLAGDTQVKRSL